MIKISNINGVGTTADNATELFNNLCYLRDNFVEDVTIEGDGIYVENFNILDAYDREIQQIVNVFFPPHKTEEGAIIPLFNEYGMYTNDAVSIKEKFEDFIAEFIKEGVRKYNPAEFEGIIVRQVIDSVSDERCRMLSERNAQNKRKN